MDNATQTIAANENVIEGDQLAHDFKTATFIVSVLINLVVLTTWLAIQFNAA